MVMTETNPESERIVLEMVERLRELQGSGEYVPVGRKVIAGEGLHGGGGLTEDVTITVDEALLATINAAKELVGKDLPDRGEVSEMISSSLPKAAPRVYYRDFTVMDAPAQAVTAPAIHLGEEARLVSAEVTVSQPGARPVEVTVMGSKVTVPAKTGYGKITMNTVVKGPLQVSVEATDAAGIVVSVRIEEAPA